MKLPRREFLKKTGVFTAAGMLPAGIYALDGISNPVPEERSFLIRDAEIISMDGQTGDLEKGSILVQKGEIKTIAKNIELPANTEEIDGTGGIVMPGLIDCHWHLWTSVLRGMSGDTRETGYFPMTARYAPKFTRENMKVATQYAVAEAINAGITTLADYNHNARNYDYVLAGCEAMAQSGIRARVEYNGYRDKPSGEPTDFEGIEKVISEFKNNPDYHLLFPGLGSRGAGYDHLNRDWERARALGMGVAIHASSNQDQKGQIWQLQERGLLGKDVNIIHGNAITRREIEAVAAAGASITITPFTELRIGYGMLRTNELLEAGINTCIGVDTTALSGNADLFAVMKVIRNIANATARDEFYLDAHRVLQMGTINGAKTLGVDNITGSLTPGKRADLIMLKKNDLNFSTGSRSKNLLVGSAQPQNVDLVAVDGKILKRNGKLTSLNSGEIVEKAKDLFQRLHREVNE